MGDVDLPRLQQMLTLHIHLPRLASKGSHPTTLFPPFTPLSESSRSTPALWNAFESLKQDSISTAASIPPLPPAPPSPVANCHLQFQEADEKLHLLSPTDDTPLPPVSKATENHVDLAVTAALAAFPAWDNLGFLGRKPFLFKLAALMRENVEDFAAIEALNLGRHVQDTIGEVMFTSGFLEYFADAAQDVIGESRIGGAGMVAMEMK